MSFLLPEELLSRNDQFLEKAMEIELDVNTSYTLEHTEWAPGYLLEIPVWGQNCFPVARSNTHTHTYTHTTDEELYMQVFAPARGRCKQNRPNPKPVTQLVHIHLHYHAHTHPSLSQLDPGSHSYLNSTPYLLPFTIHCILQRRGIANISMAHYVYCYSW